MPHLVSATGARIPLRQGHTYTVGRGRDSDIVVSDRACSRLHARIHVNRAPRDVILEDLKSRNGTYVDGDRLRWRALARDGSRLRLGASVFLLRLQDEEELQFADTSTFDDASAPHDMEAGELARTGLIEVLTRLLIDRRSVTLHAALAEGTARVEVRDGEVQRARCGGLDGFNALVRLGRQKSGIFWLTPNETPCGNTIGERPDRLLSQLARCLEPMGAAR